MRFAFGVYTANVGEITYMQEDEKMPIACSAPARIQAVAKLWRRYGPMREEALESCCYCRVVAPASAAAFEGESVVLTAGGPISGVLEATSGAHPTDQLSGWNPDSAAEWELRSPRTFPDGGLELNGDAISALPALARDHFGRYRPPNVPYARLY